MLVFYWLPLILRANTHTHTHTHTHGAGVLLAACNPKSKHTHTHTHTHHPISWHSQGKTDLFWGSHGKLKEHTKGPHPQPLWSLSLHKVCTLPGSPGDASDKEPLCQCRRHKRQGFNPWVGRRKWVFLPGKSHGQRSLADYSPWGLKRAGHDLTSKQV